MGFCTQCGEEVGEGTVFCPSCGASIKGEKKVEVKKGAGRIKMGNLDPRTLLLISTTAVGALGLICLLLKDALGLVIAGGACAALFFGGVKKLDQNDKNTAQMTALIVGIAVTVIGLVTLFLAGGKAAFLGILDIAAVVPAFMAWNMLRT